MKWDLVIENGKLFKSVFLFVCFKQAFLVCIRMIFFGERKVIVHQLYIPLVLHNFTKTSITLIQYLKFDFSQAIISLYPTLISSFLDAKCNNDPTLL